MGKNDILKLISTFSVPERLQLIEEIIKGIREEQSTEVPDVPPVLELAGILTDDEAWEMENAVHDARKIDLDGW